MASNEVLDLVSDDDEEVIMYPNTSNIVDVVEATSTKNATTKTINIKTIYSKTAKTEIIQCDPADTIRKFKRKVEQTFNVPSEHQRLIFQGKFLKPFTAKLSSFGIASDNAIVHLAGLSPETEKRLERENTQKKRKAATSSTSNSKKTKTISHSMEVNQPDEDVVELYDDEDLIIIPSNEKRAKRYRSRPNAAMRARIERAQTQRLYLANQCRNEEEKAAGRFGRDYTVLGSTGNVYTVRIKRVVECTCPDAARKNSLCKHVLFVMLKVLKVSTMSDLFFQTALLQSELRDIFQNAPKRITVRANAAVVAALANGNGNVNIPQVERKPIQDQECAICFETMSAGEDLDWCKYSCGNSIHNKCIQMWLSQNKVSKKTCPLCRTVWDRSATTGQNEGYVNLASLQGMSTTRDFPTIGYSYDSYY